MEINIKNCKIYIISSSSNEKYHNRYLKLKNKLLEYDFDIKNIELFEYLQKTTYEESLAKSVIQIFEKELDKEFKPFIILEDDCDITNNYVEILKNNLKLSFNNIQYPDALYLGISKCNASPKNYIYDEQWRMKTRNINDIYFQIFNMLSAHAILYCSQDYLKFIYKYLYDIYIVKNSIIVYYIFLARIQSIRRIYALKKPIFYQNDITLIQNIHLTNFTYEELDDKQKKLTYTENMFYKTINDIKYFENNNYYKSEIAFVTCYFETKNKYQNNEIYFEWMTNLLQNLNHPLVIYTDINSYQKILKIRGHLMNKTEIVITSLDDIYTHKYIDVYNIQFEKDTEKNYHNTNLYKIWNNKIDFVKKSVENNYFNSYYYIWIDIGLIRDKNLNKFIQLFPDIHKIKNECGDKIGILQIAELDKKYFELISEKDERNVLTKFDLNVEWYTFGGGMIIFNKNNIYNIHSLYFNLIDKYINNNRFIGKDQIIYANIVITYPELFYIINSDNIITNKYNQIQRNKWFYMLNHFLPDNI